MADLEQENAQHPKKVLDEDELEVEEKLAAMTIEKKSPEVELVDIMGGAQRWEVFVSDDKKGMVALVDCMPRLVPKGQTADYAICQSARVSYGQGTKKISEDKGLIRYLSRHRHTTPFEMVEFKFHCSMPIFVARQWIRHRTANVNEYSARYSVMPDKFYRPKLEDMKKQSLLNKQGGDEKLDDLTAQEFLDYLENVEKSSYEQYQKLIEKGVAREQARIGLPVNIFTEWYWKCDLHNTFHFLSLRMDKHAQKEIRDYAFAMFKLIKDIVPFAAEAFIDYRLNGMFLSKVEIQAIQNKSKQLAVPNKRENDEFAEKVKQLQLNF